MDALRLHGGRSLTRRVMAILLAVFIVGGFAVSNAPEAQALRVAKGYYDDYFKSKETCMARGNSLLKSQPDWIGFKCYRNTGDTKWSMDAYIDDGTGCIVAPAAIPSSVSSKPEGDVDSIGVTPLCG